MHLDPSNPTFAGSGISKVLTVLTVIGSLTSTILSARQPASGNTDKQHELQKQHDWQCQHRLYDGNKCVMIHPDDGNQQQ